MMKSKGSQTSTGSLPLNVIGVQHDVMAGPFRAGLPENLYKVCLTRQCPDESAHHFPIPDFSTPGHEATQSLIEVISRALLGGQQVYVGCTAGLGRTGTILACLTKVLEPEEADPVAKVRRDYRASAVETSSQEDFVASFDAKKVRRRLRWVLLKARLKKLFRS